MNKKYTLLLIASFFISASAFSQSFLSTNGTAIVNEPGDTIILRGMGLGGWMLQEGYMLQTAGFASAQYQIRGLIEDLIGEEDTQEFYDAWLDNHVRKIDIDSLAAWGFNSVRLPMHYNLFTLPVEDEPVPNEQTWLDRGFELTDSLISWCAQNEMYVILDLHAAPGGQGMDQGISDYDPTKPSLWQSAANRNKTVALWKRLAERYIDEPWIAGYDLLNEVNWNLPGGTQLRLLYEEITDSIRAIGDNHIIFIEGNWFANDFTGLTPPWDDNMVYSPHKYWSFNDANGIDWVLPLRDNFNVPLYFGECGENSNTWFRDAIRLFEDNDIGWAWWPMKKIESISGPLSVTKTSGYQWLLDYWSGSGSPPSPTVAKGILLEMADNLKLENCFYQKDVIDAMFRQVYSDETKPYNTQDIPGVVYASDFDMGRAGFAYQDTDLATYHVNTGNFTAWNKGWAYRNDGVDVEPSLDWMNSNGYMVGFIADNEWMQYDVNVNTTAVYEVHVRVASGTFGGSFHLSSDGGDITGTRYTPNSGGWQNWQTVIVPDVVMDVSNKKLKFHVDSDGFNLGSMEFVQTGVTTDLPTEFLSALTVDNSTIQLNLNKPLSGPIPASPAEFIIYDSGLSVPITSATLNPNNTRVITFEVNHQFESTDIIRITYEGDQIFAEDGTILDMFTFEEVLNTLPVVHPVPGRVEAEDFFFESGIQLENTSDTGGGQNVGFLDSGDYMDYYINVLDGGVYQVDYRTAAESATGAVQMQLIAPDGTPTILHTVNFSPTGGWQDWTTTSTTAGFASGVHHIRVLITGSQFNLNWFEFSFLTSTEDPEVIVGLSAFPNPNNGLVNLEGSLNEAQDLEIVVYNLLGQAILTRSLEKAIEIKEQLDLSAVPEGKYIIAIYPEQGSPQVKKIIKTGF
ncbi:MAG: carbohydrate-binding protein [Bacteroidota bacterium]